MLTQIGPDIYKVKPQGVHIHNTKHFIIVSVCQERLVMGGPIHFFTAIRPAQ